MAYLCHLVSSGSNFKLSIICVCCVRIFNMSVANEKNRVKTFLAILKKKIKGEELSSYEIGLFIKAVSDDILHDAQIGAMLVALYKHMTEQETASLTSAMANSGLVLKWEGVVVDKHSTGGVGDKVSIPLAPALAALGLKVPMLSGRGLGLTGGTLDKLESINNFKVELTKDEMKTCIDTVGCFIAATTQNICVADKKLYKIRDITETVDSLNLIVASILSKKMAEGTDFMVLDIKVGEVTNCKTIEQAKELARLMLQNAEHLNFNLKCVITKMDEPIGTCVGNLIEIYESIEVLRGKGNSDLLELVTYLGGVLLEQCGEVNSLTDGISAVKTVLENGKALEKFQQMLICQGVSEQDAIKLCQGYRIYKLSDSIEIKATNSGWVSRIDAYKIGSLTWELGSGRANPDEQLNYKVGAEILLKTGAKVEKGQTWIVIYTDKLLSNEQISNIESAIEISQTEPKIESRIITVL